MSCPVVGCGRPVKEVGLCSGHAARLHRSVGLRPEVPLGMLPKGARIKHGFARTPTYVTWGQMKQRCSNPKAAKYNIYGGRGIIVCERWFQFENFLADMGERPKGTTLDRIDSNRNYEPGNCRWATIMEQRQNQRPPSPEAQAHMREVAIAMNMRRWHGAEVGV